MKKTLLCILMALLLVMGCAQAEERTNEMKLYGPMGERFDANMQNWLLTAPYQNPGMVQMYFQRNQPHQDLVPWYGEFSGKYLTSTALSYLMQPNDALKEACDYVVNQLALAQDENGYLGVWPDSQKLAGKTPNGDKTWDAWSHYHNMLGLYLWHQATGSEQAAQVLNKAVACLYDFYITQDHKLDEDKDGTDAAIGHICALLYQETGDERCLALVQKTFATFEAIFGGDYYNAGLAGKPFYKMNCTRWECLHAIQTIKGMYDITGEESYKTAFSNIWDGIRRYARHNTGGFSSGEQACGNPYDTHAIETCCTIAWMALTDDPYVADELELATWNALIGAQQPSGRSFTYNTPMLGDKKASELNCCSINGPRGLGMIGQWGLTVRGEDITVNYYGASETRLETASGHAVTIIQSGAYPFGPDLTITVSAPADYEGTLRLWIPTWSEQTSVTRNGKAVEGVTPGSYLTVDNVRGGDVFTLAMDMSLHFWQGNYELGGKTSLYMGPILLACDQRFNDGQDEELPALCLSKLTVAPAECPDTLYPAPYLLVRVSDGENGLTLCDFASAGQTGATYTTWLPTLNELPILRESGDAIIFNQRLPQE